MRKADIIDTTLGDFFISTANVRTIISLFPLFGDLGFKVEERKCADSAAGPHFSMVAEAAAFL
jgi:hypothetical protein